ncbi:hypothetical protein [Gracilibacillus alcaliphilus]|uniref:hypothetical protein n=1 Tax=Gracilibacillus alcaliphilus TaxID=1401441 RepID=UPI001956CC64|nr:hypothetical protein [Gracilibacillus alcaliphilus]MBM7678387.1 hypothetical protein [Gracilibacillus alcaliphilus]
MAKAIKDFITAFFISFFTKWLEDFFILSAVIIVVVNTYLITVINYNILAGNYVLAAFLFIIGIFIARR